MTISLTLAVVKSFVSGVPTVTATASAPSGIPGTPFVFSSDTAAYDHVASVIDLRNYGPSTVPFYLVAAVTRPCATVAEAYDFATFVENSIKRLVTDWSAESGFESSTTQTITV